VTATPPSHPSAPFSLHVVFLPINGKRVVAESVRCSEHANPIRQQVIVAEPVIHGVGETVGGIDFIAALALCIVVAPSLPGSHQPRWRLPFRLDSGHLVMLEVCISIKSIFQALQRLPSREFGVRVVGFLPRAWDVRLVE